MNNTYLLPLAGWGINVTVHDLNFRNLDLLIASIRQLRFSWIRFEFDFHRNRNDELEIEFLRRCNESGIRILGLLNGSVPGNLRNVFFPEKTYKPVMRQKKTFIQFSETIVSRYGQIITHWEIWNEQNTKRFWISEPDASEYVNFLRDVVAHIKLLQKDAIILMGGILSSDVKKFSLFQKNQFYQQCMDNGAEPFFDFGNFHPYTFDSYISMKSYGSMLRSVIKEMDTTYRNAQRVSRKNLWFTEYGIATKWKRLKPSDIARIYVSCLAWCRIRKIPLFLWSMYDLKNPNVEFLSPEGSFGLLNTRMEPKPVYDALVRLVRAL